MCALTGYHRKAQQLQGFASLVLMMHIVGSGSKANA
jgi:hypothetical protein